MVNIVLVMLMTHCTKCGTKNEDGAKFCVNCGASLYPKTTREKRDDSCFGEKRAEDECFGLPHGGAIAGIIIGMIIVLYGFTTLLGLEIGPLVGPIIAIIIGVLIVAGAIYALTRKR